MKATLNLKLLKNDIKKAYRLLPKRSSHPLLDCFLFDFQKNKLFITATDLFSGIKISQPAEVEEGGIIAINGKFFHDLINSLDCEEIKLHSSPDEENKVILETKKEKINLPVFDSNEYPDVGKFDSSDQEFSLLKEEFSKISSLITFVVSNDLNKPIFNSFYFDLNNERSVVVGTDSVRLTYLNLETKNKENKKLLIPKKNFSDLFFMVSEIDNLKISLFYKEKENLIFLKNNDSLYFTKLNSGEYPPYEKIIPEENDFKVIISKGEFLKTLKKLSFFVRDNSNITKLEIKEDKIKFLAQSSESGKYEGEISILNKSKGSGIIAFNIIYLLDYLNSIKGEEVEMMFSGSNKPALFVDLSEKNSKHLIMPFALND